jgi:hypothetical protein
VVDFDFAARVTVVPVIQDSAADPMQLELVGGGGVRPMSLDDEGGPAFLV